MSVQKRRLSPYFGVGQPIQIIEILTICLRFEFTTRLDPLQSPKVGTSPPS
jgi:hypothetical protein